MNEINYCCKYRNHRGEAIVETVRAASPKAAERALLLKHPLAELIDVPTVIDNDGLVAKGGVKDNKRLIVWICSLGSLCLALIGVILGIAMSSKPPQKAEDVQKVTDEKTKEELAEEKYVIAYRNIVSVHTDKSTGTGFKLKLGDRVYLYTCLHCIVAPKQITAKDATDNILELGDLELCYDRDLVRFVLPKEKDGFELAGSNKIKVNTHVMAYGDTSGKGVMTQNKGKILALGNHKIEIDAAVLSGNSGGPVLNDEGEVVGVVSSGSIDSSIWAKETRYEKVRKYAERADGGNWEFVSYDDFRDIFSFIYDTYLMTVELRNFSKEVSGRRFSERVVRSFANDQEYVGEFGYPGSIKEVYEAWNDMVSAEDERQLLWEKTNGKIGTKIEENAYYAVVKKRNALQRQATVTLPLKILNFAVDELRVSNMPCFDKLKDALLKDVETVLIPAFAAGSEFSDRLDKRSYETYQHDYNGAR